MTPKLIKRAGWATRPDVWNGEIEGAPFGAGLCIIFNVIEAPGGGPRLHKHPYAETFIIREGTAHFTVGEQELIAEAGDIVVCPADTPHKFTNAGPGRLETIDIHEAGAFSTEWLD